MPADTEETYDDLMDYIFSSTREDDQRKWNRAFRYNFMKFNEHGPQLISRIKLQQGLIDIARHAVEQEKWNDHDDVKFLALLDSFFAKSELVLFGAGSINGDMINAFLVKKQRNVMMFNNKEAAGIFGNNKNNNFTD